MPRPSPRLHRAYTLFDRLCGLWDRLADLFGRGPAPARRSVRLSLEGCEDRIVPDGGRPYPNPVIFAGDGGGAVVRGYDALTGTRTFSATPYAPSFAGGVRVAAADFTGDGYPDVVVAPGPGGGPNLKILDGHTGSPIAGPLGSFWAFGPTFLGGVNVAAADVDGDGVPDVVAAAGPGGGPHVRVFSGKTGQVIATFFAFEPGFRGGISVAAADLTGDGKAEVAVGAGAGGAPRVVVYDPLTATPVPGPLGSFYAFAPSFRGGVYLGADALTGDVNGDGVKDLAAGSGPGMTAEVRAFSGATGAVLRDLAPFGPFAGGARVGLAYVDDDPYADLVVGSGPGTTDTVRVFSGATGLRLPPPQGEYAPFGAAAGGVYVAATNDPIMAYVYGESEFGPAVVGQTVGFRFTVVRQTGYPTPTGTLTFYDSIGGAQLGTATLVAGADGNAYAGIATPWLGTSAGQQGLQEGVRAVYGGDAVYAGNGGAAYVSLSAGPLPEDCGCGRQTDPGPGAGPAPGGVTGGGVRTDGSVRVTRSDLAGRTGADPAGQTWAWTTLSAGADGLAGTGSASGVGLSLYEVNPGGWGTTNGSSLALIDGGNPAVFFDKYYTNWPAPETPTFHPRFGGQYALTEDGVNGLVVVRDGAGSTYTFWDFSSANVTAGLAGRLKAKAAPDGSGAAVYSSDPAGRPTEVRATAGSGAGAVTESIQTVYDGSGRATTVTQRRAVGGGAAVTVRSAAYTYYDGTTGNGPAGALERATVSDGAGAALDTSYYRYYAADTFGGGGVQVGYAGGLKYALGPAAYERLRAAVGGTDALVDAAPDSTVAGYADKYFEYDSSRRVTKEVAAGEGTYTYSYTDTTALTGPNAWAHKTVETLPDGNTNTYYTNAQNAPLLTVYTDTTASQSWATFDRYDDRERLVLEASPSAVAGYSEAYPDLVNYGGSPTYLSASAGLVTTYTYADTTTATTGSAGDVAGYLKETDIRQGTGGTPVKQSARTYIQTPAGTFVTAASTVYRNDDGTGGRTTSLSYTWQGSTAQPASVTTTLPAVTTGENGSGTANSSTTVYDAFGRPAWAKDAAGFLTYTAYDPATGAAVKTIADVDTTRTTDFADLPTGWSTPAGGGLHLVTTYQVDALGRTTKVTHPGGEVDYTVYLDASHEVRYYPGWNGTTNTPTGPTTVSREDRAGNYTETLTMTAAPHLTGGVPDGTEAVGGLQSLARQYRNAAGQVVSSDAYFDLSGLTYSTSTTLGAAGVNFYRTAYGYDGRGRQDRVVSPQGTITRTVSDGQGRKVSEWVGTDDTPTAGEWSPANTAGTDLVKVREYEYDGGGVGDGNLTKVTEHPGLGAADRVTQTWYDWRDRAVATKGGVEATEAPSVNRPLVATTYDNLGEVTLTRQYDGDGITPTISGGVLSLPAGTDAALRAQTGSSYDELGRVYRSDTYGVDPSTGAVGPNTLYALTWYDGRGNVVKELTPGGLVTKSSYDGAGRTTVTYLTDGGGDSAYGDALDVTGDAVLEQTEPTYDADGKVLSTLTRQRFHDATGTGPLGDPTSGIGARVYYSGSYYDAGGRLTATVDVGTNGGSSWTRPSSVPARSDTVLVTSYTYDDAGRVFEVTDPRGIVNRTYYDALGRTTRTIEDYVDGVVSDTDDKTAEYTYNSAGMTSLTAKLTGGGVQTTAWVYGVTRSSSGITSNDIVGATRWPDPATGQPSSSQEETTTVNALGQTVTGTDRNGTTHTLSYDVLGRVVSDAVTALGAGVDGAVRRVETAYDGPGNPYLVTSYDAATGGTVVNQVQRAYNGLGQLVAEYQEHGVAVNTATSPKVRYAYSEMPSGADHSRLTGITYPSGYVLTYNYSAGLNDGIGRLSSLSDATGTLESYSYLGPGTVVIRSHPQPGIDLSYVKQSGEADGDAGDQYTGLDRFGRVVDQRWLNTTSGTATDRFQYTYDRDGNRLTRGNPVNPAFGEAYTYDGLNQLASFARGTSRTLSWDYDAVGNFDGVTTNGGSPVTRTANAQNEITSIGGATTPAYDANGNMTGDETGKGFVYDAWNRLVAVKDSGGSTLETFAYDGLNRRVTNTVGSTITDLFYSSQWQVLEEQVAGATIARYVWGPVYVDALVLRDRDTDANGTPDERLWVQQDANWNVTSIVDGSGVVQERYVYDPYGSQTIYSTDYSTVRSVSLVSMPIGFQGTQYDSISGLNQNRSRWYSASLGRFVSADFIRFTAGDVNFYRMEGNDPANSIDPMGLYKPCKVYEQIGEVYKKKWLELEKNGWRLKDHDKAMNPAGLKHDYTKEVLPTVSDDKMTKMLANGVDIEWHDDIWAVDYTNKRIYLDTLSDDKAAHHIVWILSGLNDAGAAAKWNGTYDVSFSKGNDFDTALEYKATGDAIKDWLIQKKVLPPLNDNTSPSVKRAVLMIWKLENNQAVKSIKDLTGFAPNFASGPPGWRDNLINAFKLYGDGVNAKALEEAKDKIEK